jgi:hypothetical protein
LADEPVDGVRASTGSSDKIALHVAPWHVGRLVVPLALLFLELHI